MTWKPFNEAGPSNIPEVRIDEMFGNERAKAMVLNLVYTSMLKKYGPPQTKKLFEDAKLPVPNETALAMLREYIARSVAMFPEKMRVIRERLLKQ